jgi:hypothetical protein
MASRAEKVGGRFELTPGEPAGTILEWRAARG